MYYVYLIKNTINNKTYIGLTDNLLRRWKSHINNKNTIERPLYKALRKHGEENFVFSVLFECNDKQMAISKEISMIKEYQSFGKHGYNLTEGGYIPSESIRKTNSERLKRDNPMTKLRSNRGSFKPGQKPIITEERNNKIRASKLGSKNHNYGNKNAADHMHVQMTCEHCGKIISKGNYYRWHGDKCKDNTFSNPHV